MCYRFLIWGGWRSVQLSVSHRNKTEHKQDVFNLLCDILARTELRRYTGWFKAEQNSRRAKRKNAGVVWGKSVFGESGLILERTVSSFWHRISPLLRRLVQRGVKERKGARKGLKRHGVECVCWHSHENCGTTIIWERVSTRPFLRPPEMGLFCSGSSTENFLRETGSVFIAQEPELLPLSPFLSWRPPRANMAGDAGLLAPLASRERPTRTPRGAPSSKGSARCRVGLSSPVCQSPFSSSFCRLFCIWK